MLTDADREAIDTLRERLTEAILAGDTDAYLSCLTDNATLLHPDSPQVRGKEALRTYLTGMFEAVSVDLLELKPVIVEGGDRFAYEVGTQECVIEPPLPGFSRIRQHLHVYQKQEDGSWLIAAAMSGNQ
ncbi:MAG: YybH family protein [Planctomycetota bacterium]|jgi:uncharacterized protein (TIGR02246 family)